MTDTSRLTAKIERAIDALLRALIAADPAETHKGLYALTDAEIDEADVDDLDLDIVIADPVGAACRSELASLGGFLFETLGTIDDMDVVRSRIASLDATNTTRREALLEECWAHLADEDA